MSPWLRQRSAFVHLAAPGDLASGARRGGRAGGRVCVAGDGDTEKDDVEQEMTDVYLKRRADKEQRERASMDRKRRDRRRRSRKAPLPAEGLLGTQPKASEPPGTWWTIGRSGLSRNDINRFVDEEVAGGRPEEVFQSKWDKSGPRMTSVQAGVDLINRDFVDEVETFLEKPIRRMSAGTMSILLGFFCATSAATIIGSVADWDPLAAAVLIIWTEGFTRYFYKQQKKLALLQMLNAFKVGLTYGMIVDSFKLCT